MMLGAVFLQRLDMQAGKKGRGSRGVNNWNQFDVINYAEKNFVDASSRGAIQKLMR